MKVICGVPSRYIVQMASSSSYLVSSSSSADPSFNIYKVGAYVLR
jgi:hypothetical protein